MKSVSLEGADTAGHRRWDRALRDWDARLPGINPYTASTTVRERFLEFCRSWYAIEELAPYYQRPPDCGKAVGDLAARLQCTSAVVFKRLLLYAIANYGELDRTRILPAEIRELTFDQFVRITDELTWRPDEFYSITEDRFVKDLAIARGSLWPCRARLVKPSRGLPRSALWRQGLSGTWPAVSFITTQCRRFGPMLDIHVHLSMLDDFNPSGWRRALLSMSEILRVRTDLTAILGSAWFYDPVVERISPHLAFNRELPLRHGAMTFFGGCNDGAKAGATANSATRRRLVASGEYRPATWYLVWPRAHVLRWAEQETQR